MENIVCVVRLQLSAMILHSGKMCANEVSTWFVVVKCDYYLFIHMYLQKGFPLDANIDEIQDTLRPYGKLMSTMMRRTKDDSRAFKVCVTQFRTM
jgi:hypothetical protein